jgi:hypothetical protein
MAEMWHIHMNTNHKDESANLDILITFIEQNDPEKTSIVQQYTNTHSFQDYYRIGK